jgi:hypothetical protein
MEAAMDHRHIEEAHLVLRYVMGNLPSDEREQFEEHLIDCPQCLDQIEATGRFRDAFRRVAAERLPDRRPKMVGWFHRRRVLLIPVFAALAAVIPVVLWLTARQDLAETRLALADWKTRYERDHQPGTAPQVPGEESPLVANAAVYRLVLNRGATEPATATNRVEVSPDEKSRIVLLLEWQATAEFQAYRARITNGGGEVLWDGEGRRQSDPDYLALILPAGVLAEGTHTLTLEGRTIRGGYVPATRYQFSVVRASIR